MVFGFGSINVLPKRISNMLHYVILDSAEASGGGETKQEQQRECHDLD
jgi:hypothetical protein